MSTLEETLRTLATPHATRDDIDGALAQVGPQARGEVEGIERNERAALADRFVRNLRNLSVHDQAKLERLLLLRLDATPSTVWTTSLDSSVSLIELRNHLKQALAVLGLEWSRATRVQSLVGGVARWLQSLGTASLRVHSREDSLEFHFGSRARGLTPELVRDSPMLQMVRDQISVVEVRQLADAVEIHFTLTRPH